MKEIQRLFKARGNAWLLLIDEFIDTCTCSYIWYVSLSKGIGIIFVLRGFFIGWNYCLCEQSTCANERIFLQIKSVETITSNTPELRKLTSNTKPDSQRYWKQKHKVSVNIDIYICIYIHVFAFIWIWYLIKNA